MKENYFKTNELTNNGKPLNTQINCCSQLNSLPLYWQDPTQPTTNRKTEADFGEEDELNNGGALHGCDRLVGYPWALL